MLSINEEFYSIQGEGLHTGIPMYFVRLQGCTVGCYFCDTKYTWKAKEQDIQESDIVKRCLHSKASWMCITGGEPYEQDLESLTENCRLAGISTCVETSGTKYQDVPIDWITLSPKDLFSKKKTNLVFRKIANEIKCVVTKLEDVEYYLRNYYTEEIPFIFQCVDNRTDLIDGIMKQTKGMNIRIMLQQHKVMQLR